MSDVNIYIDGDTKKYIAQMEKALRKTDQVGKKTKQIKGGWQGVGKSVSSLVPGIGQLATGAGVVMSAMKALQGAAAGFRKEIEQAIKVQKEFADRATGAAGGAGMAGQSKDVRRMLLEAQKAQVGDGGSAMTMQAYAQAYEAYMGGHENANLAAARSGVLATARASNVLGAEKAGEYAGTLGRLRRQGVGQAEDIALLALQAGSKGRQTLDYAIEYYLKDRVSERTGASLPEWLQTDQAQSRLGRYQTGLQALRASMGDDIAPGYLERQEALMIENDELWQMRLLTGKAKANVERRRFEQYSRVIAADDLVRALGEEAISQRAGGETLAGIITLGSDTLRELLARAVGAQRISNVNETGPNAYLEASRRIDEQTGSLSPIELPPSEEYLRKIAENTEKGYNYNNDNEAGE